MRVSAAADIGTITRQRRQELGLSQVDLAQRAGVTRQWLTRFEHGNTQVSLAKTLTILRELGLAVRVDAPDDAAAATVQVPRMAINVPRIPVPKMSLPDIRIPETVLAKLNE
jgi:HTH-type transcriptional regulator/antitoxin HipB